MPKGGLINQLTERVLSNMWFFYGVIFLIFWPMVKNNQAIEVAKLRTLNRLMPPLHEFVNSHTIEKPLSEKELDKYLFYYVKVADYLPKNADAYYMQGYCLTKKGLLVKAVEAYRQSIELNPHFFWSYYNLGLLYLKLNQWDSAAELFQKALLTKPETTIKIILTSKVFQQLLAQLEQPPGQVLPNNLKVAYKDCQQLIVLMRALKAASADQIPDKVYNQLEAKIF